MSWFEFSIPLVSFLILTVLNSTSQSFGVPSGTLTTLGEVAFSIYIALRLRFRLFDSMKYLIWAPIGFAMGDLAYGFNHYIVKQVYLGSIGPLSYAIPYVVGLSVALFFLHRLCRRSRESRAVLILGYGVATVVFILNMQAIVIPSLFQKSPPLPIVIAVLTVMFSVLESCLVGLSAVLLVLSSSVAVQILLFGLLAISISDIALRYQSVYMNLLGMTIFENGWFFGLGLMATGVNLLFKLNDSDVRKQFSQFMRFYSIRAMTAGYVLLGLCLVWFALSYYFKSLHIADEVSGSLLIALGIFGFAILVADFVDKNLSLIIFKLAEERPLQRQQFPESLPQEIRAIVEYFQKLNGKITSERDHTLSLSSKIAHNIKSPIQALKIVKYSLFQHMNSGCTCCMDLKDQLNLLDISSQTITDIANHVLAEKKRLIGLETVSSSIKKAVALASVNFPRYKISVEVSPEADITPVSGLTENIINLIYNAAEASEPNRPIFVRGFVEGEKLTVSVIDQGKGIPHATLQQLRLGRSFTTKSYGHGIGVSSMFAWAKDRGYEVDIKSKTTASNSGTMVSIRIPAALWMDEPSLTVSQ